jgi:MFS family permease
MQRNGSIAINNATVARTAGSGWPVVAASVIGLFFHFGSLLVVTFGLFLKPLSEQFNWTRTQVSLAFTLACLTALCSMLVVGWLTDRYGARRVIILSLLLFGVLFTSLSLLAPHLWVFYAIFAILGLLGPGTSAVPHASLISRWFTTRRGLALGVMMCGTGTGGILWPVIGQGLIDRVGWRVSYALLGGAVLLIAVPVLLLFLKEPSQPEASSVEKHNSGLERREAIRSETFWILMVVFFLVSAIIQACMVHLSPLLTDHGITAQRAAFALSLLGGANLIGRLGTGWLLDRFSPILVVTLSFVAIILGVVMLMAGVSSVSASIAAALIGFGYGAETSAAPFLISLYFGLRTFGEIYSYLFITVPLGGVFGPALMSMGYDLTHSYHWALAICFASMLFSSVLMLRLRSFPTFKE